MKLSRSPMDSPSVSSSTCISSSCWLARGLTITLAPIRTSLLGCSGLSETPWRNSLPRMVMFSVDDPATRRAFFTVSASSSCAREPRNSNPSALSWYPELMMRDRASLSSSDTMAGSERSQDSFARAL